MLDYTIFYRRVLQIDDLNAERWDTVLSAFNGSERVQRVFGEFHASNHHWLIHREYGFHVDELPTNGRVFNPAQTHEADFLSEYLADAEQELRQGSLCIDITGFMRPHLLLLMAMLQAAGIKSFDVLYTDPDRYARSENTTFTDGPVTEVRQVSGFEGVHVADSGSHDLMIIGAGYDHDLVHHTAENKRHARKLVMYGLPSLKPDMYQEGRLRVALASDTLGPAARADLLFSPANNPFATAQTLHDAVRRQRQRQGGVSNLYLSPLGTKPQVLGFGLYFLTECVGTPTSILFPFADRYARETTKGVSPISIYSVELP